MAEEGPSQASDARAMRAALVVDDPQATLGDVVLRLLRLGIDVFYSKDHDEAWLLAQEEALRIHALLFSPGVGVDGVANIVDCLETHAASVPRTLVVIGQRPDDDTREGLRNCGVQWALWEPYDESALRSVVSAAMSGGLAENSRQEARLPTTLLGRAFMGIHRKDVILYTLSAKGAFLETPSPYLPGSKITIEVALPSDSFVAKANVVYSKDAREAGPAAQPNGMGVEFSKLDPRSEEKLRKFLEEQKDRFAV